MDYKKIKLNLTEVFIMLELTPFGRRNRYAPVFNPFFDFDEIEKNFFDGSNVPQQMRTDIRDTGETYTLEADLPGFTKDDVKIDVENNILTIKAERKYEKEDKDKNNNLIRCERRYGSFSRSFDISEVKAEDISAKYENGVLLVTLPKKEENIPVSKQIDIQ